VKTLKNFDELMEGMRDEFRKGGIIEAHIESKVKNEVIHGLCDTRSGIVFVDPTLGIVDTLLHELLHRRYPRWGEKRVAETATNLTQAMSAAERRRWHRAYKRVAKKWGETVVVNE
jgi:hypothetical protein